MKTVPANAADQQKWMNAANVMVMALKCAGMAVMSVMLQTARMSRVERSALIIMWIPLSRVFSLM
jgi:hypothetical protein